MNHVNLDAWTRRASLLTLGAAVVAALAPPIAADAKKRKKKRNKGDVNNLQLCRKQVGQCIDFFVTFCEDVADVDACLAIGDQCCPISGDCNFSGFFFCFDGAAGARSRIGLPVTP